MQGVSPCRPLDGVQQCSVSILLILSLPFPGLVEAGEEPVNPVVEICTAVRSPPSYKVLSPLEVSESGRDLLMIPALMRALCMRRTG